MVRVLIADNDLDAHRLLDDILEINFRDVIIDRALARESIVRKYAAAERPYDIVLLNLDSYNENDSEDILSFLTVSAPSMLDKIIVMTADPLVAQKQAPGFPVVLKPYVLDDFGEVLKKKGGR